VAYVVLLKPQVTGVHLRSYLKESLPDYMIPSAFVALDALPLTPNGKVDRAALPAPGKSSLDRAKQYVAPRSPVEQSLAQIWSEVLGVERIGIEDNFFDLGGHSLLATQVVSRIRKTLQVELPLRTIFEGATIIELASQVEAASREASSEMEKLRQILEQVDKLSIEEARALLEGTSTQRNSSSPHPSAK
jgi:acyl carrier protein